MGRSVVGRLGSRAGKDLRSSFPVAGAARRVGTPRSAVDRRQALRLQSPGAVPLPVPEDAHGRP
jgi:hypothetical protein